MTPSFLLVLSAFAMVLLSALVAVRLLVVRTREMRRKRVHPQAASTSIQMAARLEDVQAADNFRNLFEVPVLFYALVATALATAHTPGWLVAGAWVFVGLRVAHSVIHCTYNTVMHRFAVFMLGFAVVVGLWTALVISLMGRSA
jgi:hypothetical protein